MSNKSLADYTNKQLWALEERIRSTMLGADDESRRLLTNFMTYIDAEKQRRKENTTV